MIKKFESKEEMDAFIKAGGWKPTGETFSARADTNEQVDALLKAIEKGNQRSDA